MKVQDLFEAAPNAREVGIPEALIRVVFAEANLSHDVQPVAVKSKKEMMALLRNNVIFAVGSDGTAGALVARTSNWDRNPGAVLFTVDETGEVNRNHQTLSAGIAGLPRGKYYMAPFGNGGYYHSRDQRTSDIGYETRSRSNSADIQYINDTFGERLRAEAQDAIQHIKSIYFDANPRWAGNLKQAAQDLENFVKNGVTRNNIESWMIHNNKRDSGWGSHYTNIDNLFALFKEEPNARAKFARFLLDWIRRVKNQADRYASYK